MDFRIGYSIGNTYALINQSIIIFQQSLNDLRVRSCASDMKRTQSILTDNVDITLAYIVLQQKVNFQAGSLSRVSHVYSCFSRTIGVAHAASLSQ